MKHRIAQTLTQTKWWRRDKGAGGSLVGHETDFALTLLLLQTHLNPSVAIGTAAAKHNNQGPYQPEPCKR